MAMTSVLEQPAIADEVLIEAPALALTPLAESKLREIMAEKNLTNHGLRVYVAGGGCSGLQYGMAFESNPQDFDTIINQNGVKLIVDGSSLMYLSGASIDYAENVMGGGFRIDNPNVYESGCSCGSGASAEDEMGSEGGCACGGSCGCNH